MNKIIDTHCHYNLDPLYSEYQRFIAESQNAGVDIAICVGTSLETTKRALKIAAENENIFVSCGIHPSYCQKIVESEKNIEDINLDHSLELITQNFTELESLVYKHLNTKKIVAIGETGLDFFRLKKRGMKREIVEKLQKHLFRKQLELAIETQLSLILHVRDQDDRKSNAYYEVLKILNEFPELKDTNCPTKIILHCVSGPMDYISGCLELGAYIGIAGNVTYSSAEEIRSIISKVPQNRILLETDAPYLVPKGLDSNYCHPKDITFTANFLHENLNLNLDIIRKNTFTAFKKLSQK